MKRRLLAYMLLASILGTGGVIFMQPGFVEESTQALESVQQLVASKTQTTLSAINQSDVVNGILLLLAEALLLAGLLSIVTKKYSSFQFHYTQALLQNTPEKEKDRRFSRDDVL